MPFGPYLYADALLQTLQEKAANKWVAPAWCFTAKEHDLPGIRAIALAPPPAVATPAAFLHLPSLSQATSKIQKAA